MGDEIQEPSKNPDGLTATVYLTYKPRSVNKTSRPGILQGQLKESYSEVSEQDVVVIRF